MSDRKQVADALEEIGLLLDLLGENRFKTRAYYNGARIVRSLEDDLGEQVRQGTLTQIKGIGAALADKIGQLVTTGQLPYLDELRQQVPAGLLEWIAIPGLGVKKARAIHIALGISTLGELEYACHENRLRDLPDFGEASQKKILAGIERRKRYAGRFLQPLIQNEAARLLKLLRSSDAVEQAELCGSARRLTETHKAIEIVLSASTPETVLDAFCADENVEKIIDRGPSSCRVQLGLGPEATLEIVPSGEFPFKLLQLTGSEAHLAALRERAAGQDFELTERALSDAKQNEQLSCATEAEIYSALELQEIPPELREGLGEVEAAAAGKLPRLIEESDLQGALHCHSTWSDGGATVAEMAEAARALGLSYLGLSDHSQAATYAGGLDETRVREQHVEVDRLNAQLSGSFHVLKGIEVDILHDGQLDYPDELLATFDLVIASIHSRFNLNEELQTARLLRALENPYVDMLGHPTGRLLLARDGYSVDLPRVIDAAVQHGVAVEINAHPRRLDLDWRHLQYGRKQGLLSSINSDAHSTEGLRNAIYGVHVARKGGCSSEEIINTWPLERLIDHLQERRRKAGV